jgi:hypothetical protein
LAPKPVAAVLNLQLTSHLIVASRPRPGEGKSVAGRWIDVMAICA